jgi:hypothetical protein
MSAEGKWEHSGPMEKSLTSKFSKYFLRARLILYFKNIFKKI